MSSLQTESPVADPREEQQWLKRVSDMYEAEYASLADQLTNQRITSKKTVFVAGFPIEIHNDKYVKNLRAKIVDEAEKSKAIRQRLSHAGLTPIAVLPSDMFKTITASLYTFRNIQKDGRVYGNGKAVNDRLRFSSQETIGFAFFTVFVSLASTIIGVAYVAKYFFGATHETAWTIAEIVTAIQFILGLLAVMAHDNEWGSWKPWLSAYFVTAPLTFIVRLIYRTTGRAKVKKLLWPNKNDSFTVDPGADEEEQEIDSFVINLPTPPKEIQQKLRACLKHNIKTFLVVDEKAFSVVIDNKVLGRLYAKYDPIIAYEQDGMVAVIDQFGDFKGEKQAIQYIKDHFTAIRGDLMTVQQN